MQNKCAVRGILQPGAMCGNFVTGGGCNISPDIEGCEHQVSPAALPVPVWYQKLVDENERLKAAMREFCDRVDAGEVRSVRTYTKFKTLLGE